MTSAELIGERIKKIRKSKKLTQKMLADKVGTSICVISKWETGERYMNSFNLINICEALEVSADYLLFGKEQEE
ncbi:MAG TPA: helix-turn-helix transcriptional regulator [Ruminococcus sp.]|nr:helix-turn-helix transcriptional regulator [Ruminococcus sp.]